VLSQGLEDVVAHQRRDHVHDVVPVAGQAAEALNRLPGLRRIVGKQLVRDNLVHRYVQPRVDRLAVDEHVFIAAERICGFCVLRLDQQVQFGLLSRIQ
jgi:hypothetical protein